MWLLSTAFNKNLNNIFTRVSNTKLVDYELSRAQICLTIHQILENSTEGIAINLTRKIPILFEAISSWNRTSSRSVCEHA